MHLFELIGTIMTTIAPASSPLVANSHQQRKMLPPNQTGVALSFIPIAMTGLAAFGAAGMAVGAFDDGWKGGGWTLVGASVLLAGAAVGFAVNADRLSKPHEPLFGG